MQITCLLSGDSIKTIYNEKPHPSKMRDGANYLRCNLRDFPDKVINNSDFLHLLAVHLLNLADQDFADKPVQYGLVQFLNGDRKSTRLNSSHVSISYAVFCLKKK